MTNGPDTASSKCQFNHDISQEARTAFLRLQIDLDAMGLKVTQVALLEALIASAKPHELKAHFPKKGAPRKTKSHRNA